MASGRRPPESEPACDRPRGSAGGAAVHPTAAFGGPSSSHLPHGYWLSQDSLVMDPAARGPDQQKSPQHDDLEEDPGQRGGIAHVEVREALLVEVHPVEEQ